MITIEFLRQLRVGGFAIFDFATAFLGVLALSPILRWLFRKVGLEIPIRSWLFFTLPVGIIVHILTGHRTPMTVQFLDPSGYYLVKAIILILLILGFIGIKRIKKIEKVN
jgi:hypothetical protein